VQTLDARDCIGRRRAGTTGEQRRCAVRNSVTVVCQSIVAIDASARPVGADTLVHALKLVLMPRLPWQSLAACSFGGEVRGQGSD
jgi:hypothetical protein